MVAQRQLSCEVFNACVESHEAMLVGRTTNSNPRTPTAAIRIPPSYPDDQIGGVNQPGRPATPYILLDPSFAAMYATAPSSVTSFG